jgi:hypothetical protein
LPRCIWEPRQAETGQPGLVEDLEGIKGMFRLV